MTGSDFTAWMHHMGWNIIRAAAELGLGRNTVTRYMSAGAPDYIAYACSARAMNLPKWKAHG
jgi:hypothetical protein